MTDHPTPHNNIAPRTLMVIDGVDHVFRGRLPGFLDIAHATTGAPYLTKKDDGSLSLIDDAGFADLLEQGRVTFRPATATDRMRISEAVGRMTIDDAKALDPRAEVRLAVCELVDATGAQRGDKSIGICLAKHYGPELVAKFGEAPPAPTVRRWIRERGAAGRRHARDMVAMTGRARRRTSLPEIVEEVLQKHALDSRVNDSSMRAAYALFRAEIERINRGEHAEHAAPDEPYAVPSKRTLTRRIHALEQAATVRAGRGRTATEQGWEGGGRSLTADHAMHRVIIDHTRVDVHVVADDLGMLYGRPWLTLAIDVHTRAVVGWVLTFIDPCGWTVAEVLRRIALPKRPPSAMLARYPILRHLRGRPVELVLDNAAEFRSHSIEAAARAAGIGIRWCPIRKPRYRSVGERAFGTINGWLCSELPGRVLPPADTKLLGYDPAQTACIMMDELEACLNQVVAEYNTEPHEGLHKRQPALAFEQEARRRGIDVWLDQDGFRMDTLPCEDAAQLSPSGLRAFGLRFVGKREVASLLDDLVPLEGRRQRRDQATATVSYRYDPADISRIHVWNRVRREYVTLVCSDGRYAHGMPKAFHDQLAQEAAAQGAAFNDEAEREAFRARRIEAIRSISPAAGARARKAVADLYEHPRIRQITGNIVDLHVARPEDASVGEFIAHDRAALTAFDLEVRAPRSARAKHPNSDLETRRDARDAGGARRHDATTVRPDRVEPPAPRRRRGGDAA